MPSLHIPPEDAFKELAGVSEKLSRGLHHLFDVGDIPTGVTPKEVVYREDKLTLYRFKPPIAKEQGRTPLLIVYALVNRPYMTDLQEDRSIVRGLLAAGLDVYLIDWGYPDRADRYLALDDYINGYLDRCVDVLRRRCGVAGINMLGICQGGTFSLCYAALHPEKVRNLVTMVTPVDFHTAPDVLSRWIRHVDVDAAVDAFGNVPGEILNWMFLMLKPYRLMGQKYVDLIERLDDAEQLRNFLSTEKWIFDSPDQAGEAFREFLKYFYQQNRLVKGGLAIGGRDVSLRQVTMPVLNVYATEDHLVPPPASTALQHHVGTHDYRELAFPGGHIGIYISGKSQKQVPPAIGAWIAERSGEPPRQGAGASRNSRTSAI